MASTPKTTGTAACRGSPIPSSAKASRSACLKTKPPIAGSSRPICSGKCRPDRPSHPTMAMILMPLGQSGVEGWGRLVYMRTAVFNHGSLPHMNKALPLLGAAAILLLAGCSSTRVAVQNYGQTEQLAAVQTGNVSATALPPIGPNGEVQGPAPLTPDPMGDPALDGQAGVSGGLAALPDTGLASTGRDLSGGLTVEKLLGRWTVVSGADQCQLNLTQTAKTGTG